MAARTKAEVRWQTLVREQEASGRSVKDFARARGLSAASMYWWRSELERRSRTARAKSEKRIELAPLAIVGQMPRRLSSGWDFEVELSSGHRVRVASGFDADELGRLVSVLVRPC